MAPLRLVGELHRTRRRRILIVDDEPGACELLEAGLTKKGFRVAWRTWAHEALDLLSAEDFDAVVSDLTLCGMGLELCVRVLEQRPDVPVIVTTPYSGLDRARAAIRAGAYDCIVKPFELGVLDLTLERALRHRALCNEVDRLRRAIESAGALRQKPHRSKE
jgi:two-component system response regulator HydG